MTPQMQKVVNERKNRYEIIRENNEIPDDIDATENQKKVIREKYMKNADSIEELFRIVARNIALAELLHEPEFKDKIFKGVDFDEESFDFENDNLKDAVVYYRHAGKPNHDDMEENFDKFMQNLYDLVENNDKAAQKIKRMEDLFYGMMARFDFLPNSPTLMNAGRDLQQLSACYVLPIEDSVEGWGDAVKNTMLIHKSGGGTGFSGCRVRPRGSIVQSTKGVASGPISVFKMVDAMTEQIKQGGMRRGANMGILPYWHPDIETFVSMKQEEGYLDNFNVSVGIDSNFMEAVRNDEEIDLVNPHTDNVEGQIEARELWDTMINNAWATGDPGWVNLERINKSRSNPTPEVGQIESTNPCGEQPLLPYEPCNLGSINLSNFVIEDEENPRIDWDRLQDIVHLATHFLDNVIDVNNYPLPEIEKIAKENRRIGLGVMGFAEMLTKLHIPYGSEKSFRLAEEVMQFINENSLEASENLAVERGVFPNWEDSIYDPEGNHFTDKEAYPRNCARTTIAPTGTIGIAAGLQGAGIEPYFAVVYTRYTADGLEAVKEGREPEEKDVFYEVNNLLQEVAERNDYWGLEPEELWEKVDDNHGSLQGIDEIPEDVQQMFLTSHELTPKDHVRVQAAFQSQTDNGVSKTVNFKNEATVEDVKEVYEMAYELDCKGVTIYRDGSKNEQVLNLNKEEEDAEADEEEVDEEVPASASARATRDVEEGSDSVSPDEIAPAKQADHEASAYYELETGYGPIHIHINYDAEGPKKVFANLSPAGTEISGMTTALGILLSKYLGLGGDPVAILKHLNSIKGDKPHGFGKNRIDSIPHAISVALKDHLVKTDKLETGQTKLNVEDVEEKKLVEFDEDELFCPKCYSRNVAMMSGCSEPVCFDCGYSKCG